MNGDRTDDRLDLWKDIAAYLNRGVSTVQRWEKREGMPVHRHVHDKLGSIYAFRSELDEWWASRRVRLENEDDVETIAIPNGRGRWAMVLAFVAGAGATAVLGLIAAAMRAPAESSLGVVRFSVSAPEGTTWDSSPSEPNPALSPDGRHIAFEAIGPEGRSRIWVQPLDGDAARPLAGTENGLYPFWSPDGRFIAFFAQGKLKKIRVSDGPPETVCDIAAGGGVEGTGVNGGGTWNTKGQILFGHSGGLSLVQSSGGMPVMVTRLDAQHSETSHRFPQFLPDGRRFLFLVQSRRPGHQGIFLASLDSATRTRVLEVESNVAYAASSGYLLFVREATLMAQRFDPDRAAVTGEPVPLAGSILRGPTFRLAPFSVIDNVLTYRSGGVIETQLIRVDRTGRLIGPVGVPGPYPANPSLSPDGRRVALSRFDLQSGGADIWLFDVTRGVSSRFTFDQAQELAPLWSPEGDRILFASNRSGPWDVYERRLDNAAPDGAGAEHPLLQSSTNKYPQSWSPDGRMLVFTRQSAATGEDLWLKAIDGRETPYLQTQFDEREAQISPDGRWMAYASNASGQPEVYVRPFPSGAGDWKVSINGGAEPRWRGDSRELYYVGPDRRLMAAPINAGATFAPGLPFVLFDVRIAQTLWWDYDVMRNGREFLIKQARGTAPSSPLTVVLNWRATLPH